MSEDYESPYHSFSGNFMDYAVFVNPSSETDSRVTVPLTESDKSKLESNLQAAFDWVKAQAEKYEVELNLEYFIASDEILEPPYFPEGGNVGFQEETAKLLEYEGYVDFGTQIQEENEDSHVYLLTFCGDEETPSAIYAPYDELNQEFGLTTLCFPLMPSDDSKKGKSKTLPSPIVIAKYILKQFGAFDLLTSSEYEHGSGNQVAQTYIPNDIMLVSKGSETGNLEGIEITEVTAFLLGWQGEPKSWYEQVMPSECAEMYQEYVKDFEVIEVEDTFC